MLYERSTVGPSQHDRLDLEIAEHTVVKLVHVCYSIERGLGVASRTLLPGPRIRGDPFPNGVAIRRRPTGTAPISRWKKSTFKLRRLIARHLYHSIRHGPGRLKKLVPSNQWPRGLRNVNMKVLFT